MILPIAPADRALRTRFSGPPRPVAILLRTSAAAYLGPSDDDPWLVLVDDGGLVVPDSVALPAGVRWQHLLADHRRISAPILIGGGQVRCGSRALQVRADLDLRVPAAPPGVAAVASILAAGSMPSRPTARGATAAAVADHAGAPSSVPAAARAAAPGPWPAWEHTWSSGRADPETLANDALSLIGRGPGVTPSGDDILAAAILTHTVLGTPGIAAAGKRIVELSAGRTTAAALVSTRGATGARATAPVRHALTALLQDRATPDALDRVLAIGHTSGADLVRGMHDALAAAHHPAATVITDHLATTHPCASTPPTYHSFAPATDVAAERKVS